MTRTGTFFAGRTPLVLLLVTALTVRLGWGLSRPADDATVDLLPDQRGYLEAGRNLLSGAGLWFTDERFGQQVYAVRTPGYPAFVATCGGSVRAVRVAQALIDTSTALAIFLLTRRVRGRSSQSHKSRGDGMVTSRGRATHVRPDFAPLIACALVAFNPFLVYFSALLLTETLYTAMLAWAMVLLLLVPGRHGWPFGILLLALAVHVRPAGIGLPIALGVLATWISFSNRGAEGGPTPRPARVKGSPALHTLAAALVASVLLIAVLLPWAWRNHRVLGRWVWTTSNDGITAYDGFHAGATGASDQSFVARMPELRAMNELQRSDYLGAAAKRFVRENPRRLVELTLAKAARTWSPVPLSAEFGRPLHRAIALLYSVPFDVLVIVGIAAGRLPRRVKLFLLLPALYFTAIHALSVGSLRYRVPAEPPLAVLAAVGAARVLGQGRPKDAEGDTPRASPSES